MNHRNPTMKLIASTVVFTFFVTSLGITPNTFAATGVPTGEVSPLMASTLAIPAELGQVTDSVTGDPTAPAFIHIQSAHGNYQAEKNIEKLLGYIEKNSSVKLMLLEGAANKLHPELFRLFPEHPDFNRKVTDRLMQEGYLTGPERFLIENAGHGTEQTSPFRKGGVRGISKSPLAPLYERGGQMEGWGIESLDAYKKDRDAFISVVKTEKTAEKFLSSLRATIDKRFSSKLNKDLLNLVRQEEAFDSGTISFEGWIKTLGEGSRKHLKTDLSDAFYQDQYPFLIRYFRLQAIGSKIDQQKADTEFAAFIKELEQRKVSKDIISAFRATGQEPRATNSEGPDVGRGPWNVSRGKSGYSPMRAAFDAAFDKLPKDFSMTQWPNWTLYAQYIILMQEMEGKGLHEETLKLKDKMQTALAKTADEKEYLAKARELYLLRRLFSLELTRSEYEELTQTVKTSDIQGIQALYKTAMDFYSIAVDRENKMFANALKRMSQQKQDRAVIVTGGFHADGLKKLAASKGCSYIQITPRIAEVSKRDHAVYLKAMMGARDFETSQAVPLLGVNPIEKRVFVTGQDQTRAWRSEIRNLVINEINTANVAARSDLDLTFSKSIFGSPTPTMAPVRVRAKVIGPFGVRSEVRHKTARLDPINALRNPELRKFIHDMLVQKYTENKNLLPPESFRFDIKTPDLSDEDRIELLVTAILDSLERFDGNSIDAAKYVNASVYQFADEKDGDGKLVKKSPFQAVKRQKLPSQNAKLKNAEAELAHTVALLQGPVIVDIGAGNGKLLIRLKEVAGKRGESFEKLIATDPFDYVEPIIKEGPPFVWVPQLGESLNVAELKKHGPVNTVILQNVMHHTFPEYQDPKNPAHRAKVVGFLRQANEILAPGGRLLVWEDSYPEGAASQYPPSETLKAFSQPALTEHFLRLNAEQKYKYLVWNDWYWNVLVDGDYSMNMAYRFFAMEEWKEIFKEAGFEVEDAQYWGFRQKSLHGSSPAFFALQKVESFRDGVRTPPQKRSEVRGGVWDTFQQAMERALLEPSAQEKSVLMKRITAIESQLSRIRVRTYDDNNGIFRIFLYGIEKGKEKDKTVSGLIRNLAFLKEVFDRVIAQGFVDGRVMAPYSIWEQAISVRQEYEDFDVVVDPKPTKFMITQIFDPEFYGGHVSIVADSEVDAIGKFDTPTGHEFVGEPEFKIVPKGEKIRSETRNGDLSAEQEEFPPEEGSEVRTRFNIRSPDGRFAATVKHVKADGEIEYNVIEYDELELTDVSGTCIYRERTKWTERIIGGNLYGPQIASIEFVGLSEELLITYTDHTTRRVPLPHPEWRLEDYSASALAERLAKFFDQGKITLPLSEGLLVRFELEQTSYNDMGRKCTTVYVRAYDAKTGRSLGHVVFNEEEGDVRVAIENTPPGDLRLEDDDPWSPMADEHRWYTPPIFEVRPGYGKSGLPVLLQLLAFYAAKKRGDRIFEVGDSLALIYARSFLNIVFSTQNLKLVRPWEDGEILNLSEVAESTFSEELARLISCFYAVAREKWDMALEFHAGVYPDVLKRAAWAAKDQKEYWHGIGNYGMVMSRLGQGGYEGSRVSEKEQRMAYVQKFFEGLLAGVEERALDFASFGGFFSILRDHGFDSYGEYSDVQYFYANAFLEYEVRYVIDHLKKYVIAHGSASNPLRRFMEETDLKDPHGLMKTLREREYARGELSKAASAISIGARLRFDELLSIYITGTHPTDHIADIGRSEARNEIDPSAETWLSGIGEWSVALNEMLRNLDFKNIIASHPLVEDRNDDINGYWRTIRRARVILQAVREGRRYEVEIVRNYNVGKWPSEKKFASAAHLKLVDSSGGILREYLIEVPDSQIMPLNSNDLRTFLDGELLGRLRLFGYSAFHECAVDTIQKLRGKGRRPEVTFHSQSGDDEGGDHRVTVLVRIPGSEDYLSFDISVSGYEPMHHDGGGFFELIMKADILDKRKQLLRQLGERSTLAEGRFGDRTTWAEGFIDAAIKAQPRSEARKTNDTLVAHQIREGVTSNLVAKIETAIRVAANTVSPLLSVTPVYASKVAPEIFTDTIHFQKTPVVAPAFGEKWPELSRIIRLSQTAKSGLMAIDQRHAIPDAASVLPSLAAARANPKAIVVLALIADAGKVADFKDDLIALDRKGALPANFIIQSFKDEAEFVDTFGDLYKRYHGGLDGMPIALVTDREISVVTDRIGSYRELLSVVGDEHDQIKQTAAVLLAAEKLLDPSIWSMGYHFVSVEKLGGLAALMAELTSYVAAQAKVLASA